MKRPIGDWVFDDQQSTISHAKQGIVAELTPCEWKLIKFLIRSPGRLCTYEEIAVDLHGPKIKMGYKSNVRGMIKRLRQKMGLTVEDQTIRNRNGHGYLIPKEIVGPAEDVQPCICPNCGIPHYE